MRLTMNTGSELLEALGELSSAEELVGSIEAWMDLDGETDIDSRESRRDYREEFEGQVEEVESAVVAAAEAFGYVVLSVKDAKALGWRRGQ